MHVKASVELDFLRKCLGFFAQVLSGQNTTLRFHQKSDLPGSTGGDRAKPPNILIVLRLHTDAEPQIYDIAHVPT